MILENTPTLTTERLVLRKFTISDLAALLSIYKDKEVNTFLPWFPIETLEEAKALFEEKYVRNYLKPQGYYYAVCLKEDNVPIGYVNFSMEEHHDFGYGLRKEFWGQGIVTEAGRAVIIQLKKDNIPYITATHDIHNIRSGKVMKRLGMKYQYSYEEQWKPKDFLVTFRLYQLNLDGNENRVYKKYWDNSEVHFVETDL